MEMNELQSETNGKQIPTLIPRRDIEESSITIPRSISNKVCLNLIPSIVINDLTKIEL